MLVTLGALGTLLAVRQVPSKRAGSGKNGAEDIKKHKWYRGLNWAALYNKNMPPPPVAQRPEHSMPSVGRDERGDEERPPAVC